jgi:cold shock CspA family protein
MSQNTETNNQVAEQTNQEQSFTLESDTRYTGQVKWFNNKLGYGFITIRSENEHNNQDVFVHQANIKPTHSQYRTLTQGEYVSFNLGTTDEESQHKYQAVDVRGVEGGSLMCDQIRRTNSRFNGNERRNFNSGGGNRNFKQNHSQESGDWQKVRGKRQTNHSQPALE